MKNQNFCIHIYTTHKNKKRCEYIENTWGKHVDNLFFYTDKEEHLPNYIHCTDEHDYYSSMYKNMYAIEYSYKNLKNYPWHLFIGDDVFLYHYNLEKTINTLNPEDNSVYGEIIGGCWPTDRSLFYIGGGGGVLVNPTSLKVLAENIPSPEMQKYYFFSDVAIGQICKKQNIKLVNRPEFHCHPPAYYNIKNPENFVSFHYILDEKMFNELYTFYRI